MNPSSSLKKSHLMKLLLQVPEERLQEIDTFIKFVLSQSSPISHTSSSLRGVWRGKGFEQINNLQEEIDQLRRQVGENLLNKY